MESSTGKLELAVGSFVIAGIFIVMLMIVYMTGGVSFIDHTYKIIVQIENIGDLKKGAPVKMGGYQIGNVDNIFIGKKGVNVVAGIDRKYQLLSDASASIATAGLVGDAFLDVNKGIKGRPLKQADTAENAPVIHGISQPGMGEIMNQVQKIGDEVQTLVGNINKLVGKEEFRDNIEKTIDNASKASDEAQQILARVRKNMDEIDNAVKSITAVADSAQGTMKTVNTFVDSTIGQKSQAEDVNTIISNASEITSMLAKQKDYIGSTIVELSKTTKNISYATSKLDPDRGVFRLLSDEQVGYEVMMTLTNVQRAVNSWATVGLTDLIADKAAADAIFKLWKDEHRFRNAAEMYRAWDEFKARMKKSDRLMIRSTSRPVQQYQPYENCPLPTSTANGAYSK